MTNRAMDTANNVQTLITYSVHAPAVAKWRIVFQSDMVGPVIKSKVSVLRKTADIL